MRHFPTPDESWPEADAVRLVRSFRTPQRSGDFVPELADHAHRRREMLTRTVEDEVIPRLVMARRPQKIARALTEAANPIMSPNPGQVAALVELSLQDTQPAVTAYVESLRDNGVAVDRLFLDLVTPAARRLGVMWEQDLCTFSDVTLGVLRLGNVVRLLSRDFGGDQDTFRNGPSALLAQMPGEQHGLGLAMIVQFFRHAGWNIRQEPLLTSAELIDIVKHQWFGIVGVSVACDNRLEALAADIRAIRKASRNRAVGIMVGGPPFVAHPQLATMIGADTTAIDGRQAVQQAENLLSHLSRDSGARNS